MSQTRTRTKKVALPEPPAHLSDEASAFWRRIVATYVLQPYHLADLQLACEAWDRGQQARRLLDLEGITVQGEHGPKVHPAVAVERDSSARFRLHMKAIGLDAVDPPTATPPMR